MTNKEQITKIREEYFYAKGVASNNTNNNRYWESRVETLREVLEILGEKNL